MALVAKGNTFREAVTGDFGKLHWREIVLPQEKQEETSFAWMPQEEDGEVCLRETKEKR